MNKHQWLTFAIGISLFGVVLWTLAIGWNCSPLRDGELYTACVIKEQSYAIPAMFCTVFALIFFICAWLGKGAKNE